MFYKIGHRANLRWKYVYEVNVLVEFQRVVPQQFSITIDVLRAEITSCVVWWKQGQWYGGVAFALSFYSLRSNKSRLMKNIQTFLFSSESCHPRATDKKFRNFWSGF